MGRKMLLCIFPSVISQDICRIFRREMLSPVVDEEHFLKMFFDPLGDESTVS